MRKNCRDFTKRYKVSFPSVSQNPVFAQRSRACVCSPARAALFASRGSPAVASVSRAPARVASCVLAPALPLAASVGGRGRPAARAAPAPRRARALVPPGVACGRRAALAGPPRARRGRGGQARCGAPGVNSHVTNHDHNHNQPWPSGPSGCGPSAGAPRACSLRLASAAAPPLPPARLRALRPAPPVSVRFARAGLNPRSTARALVCLGWRWGASPLVPAPRSRRGRFAAAASSAVPREVSFASWCRGAAAQAPRRRCCALGRCGLRGDHVAPTLPALLRSAPHDLSSAGRVTSALRARGEGKILRTLRRYTEQTVCG